MNAFYAFTIDSYGDQATHHRSWNCIAFRIKKSHFV